MAVLTIDKLDNRVFELLKRRAEENHRSVEDEACALLAERLPDPERLRAVIADLAALQLRTREKYGDNHFNSVELVRAIRDEE
jgi:plasmid stability protein